MLQIQATDQSRENETYINHMRSANVIHNEGKPKRNDLMKFLYESKPDPNIQLKGKRCFSNNNAVSNDSPQHFQISKPAEPNQNKATLSRRGFQNPETNTSNQQSKSAKNKFYPQKHYFDVSCEPIKSDNHDFLKEYTQTINLNQHAFNKKISEYSGFVDHNVVSQWGQQYPLMGEQRSKQGRKIHNQNRDKLVEQKRQTMEVFLRTFHSNRTNNSQLGSGRKIKDRSFNKEVIRTNNDLLFGERVKLRQNRNQIANKLHSDTQSYLIRQTQTADNQLKTFYSVQSRSKEKYERQSRPLTGVKRNKSTVANRNQMFDTLLGQFGVGKHSHRRAQSTLETSDVGKESDKRMVKNIEKWENSRRDKLMPCSSSINKIESSHRRNLSKNEKGTSGESSMQKLRRMFAQA